MSLSASFNEHTGPDFHDAECNAAFAAFTDACRQHASVIPDAVKLCSAELMAAIAWRMQQMKQRIDHLEAFRDTMAKSMGQG